MKSRSEIAMRNAAPIAIGGGMRNWAENAQWLKALLLVVAFIFFANVSMAQSVDALYKSANQFYKTNQFDSAAGAYEKIIHSGYKTAEVYYNLGNCYYKLNNVSQSILNYERAVKLAPQDEDIQHNLKVANLKVVDKLIPVPQLGILLKWDSLVSSKSSRGWGTLALAFVWGSLLFFALYVFISNFRSATITLGILLLLVSFTFLSFAYKQNDKEQNPDTAILTATNTFVKSAPDNNGNDLFMLHEGIKLQLLDKVGEWHKIRLADGKVGWIERGSFEKI
jgi:tetratricopeptide (TPR) repeat protein